MYNNFLEEVQEHLNKTKSKYNIDSIEIVTSVVNCVIDQVGNKVSVDYILQSSPQIILDLYGYLWNIFLRKAKIETWEDFGNVIFTCVDLKIFKKSPEDKIEDFIQQEVVSPLFSACEILEENKAVTKNLKCQKKES